MIGCKAILAYGEAMLLGGVAFVACPAVLGILLMQAHHIFVAVGLCQNRGCGDVGILAVALDDALVGQSVMRYEAVAVDGEELRCDLKTCSCDVRALNRGL